MIRYNYMATVNNSPSRVENMDLCNGDQPNVAPEQVGAVGLFGIVEVPSEVAEKISALTTLFLESSGVESQKLWIPDCTAQHITVAHILTPVESEQDAIKRGDYVEIEELGAEALKSAARDHGSFMLRLDTISVHPPCITLTSENNSPDLAAIRVGFDKLFSMYRPQWTRQVPDITHATLARYKDLSEEDYGRLVNELASFTFDPIEFEVTEIAIAREQKKFASAFDIEKRIPLS